MKWLTLGVAVGLFRCTAFAHDADVIYVLAQARDTKVTESITLTAATLAQLAPVDANADGELTQDDLDARGDSIRAGVWAQMSLESAGAACPRRDETATLREGLIELSATYTCASEGKLRQTYRFLSVLPTNYRVVLGTQFEGERNRSFAQGTLTTLTLARGGSGGPQARITQALQEGFARCFTLDVLASVMLAFFTAKKWYQLAIALAVGLLSSFWFVAEPWPAHVLSMTALAFVLARTSPMLGWLGLLLGIAIGVRGGGDGVLILGSVLGLGFLGAPAVMIGRILQPRPRALLAVQIASLVLVLFSNGIRLALARGA